MVIEGRFAPQPAPGPRRRRGKAFHFFGRGPAEYRESTELFDLPQGFVSVDDRRLPGSHAKIDHVVIGPTGVFVLETKHYDSKMSVREGELVVNGWSRNDIVDRILRSADMVGAHLESELRSLGATVTAIVCIRKGRFRIGAVHFAGPDRALRAIKRGRRRLAEHDVVRLRDLAERRLVPVLVDV